MPACPFFCRWIRFQPRFTQRVDTRVKGRTTKMYTIRQKMSKSPSFRRIGLQGGEGPPSPPRA